MTAHVDLLKSWGYFYRLSKSTEKEANGSLQFAETTNNKETWIWGLIFE